MSPRYKKPKVTVERAGKGWGVYADGIFYDWYESKNEAIRYGKHPLEIEIKRENLTKEDFIRMRSRGRRLNPQSNSEPGPDDEIIDSMARTLFVEAWANHVEERHPEQTREWGGQDLMDLAPETPKSVYPIAEKLYAKIEDMNEESIEDVVERLDADPDLFGHYLVMESLGHGVSWSDEPRRGEHDLDLPDIETDWDGSRLWSGL